MRYEKPAALLNLARSLAASAEGLTINEMSRLAGVDRRTAERMRDALRDVFPQLEEVPDGATKRFRIPGGLDGFFQSPDRDELLELEKTIGEYRNKGAAARADALEQLAKKVKSAMRNATFRKIAPDLEALLRAELIAVHPGPRAAEEPDVFLAIRHALLAMKTLQFVYTGGSRPGTTRQVVPYGILFGRTNYLIAADLDNPKPKNFRMDRIHTVEVLDETAQPPADFNLNEFANASFGFFQGEQEDIVLHVFPHGVDDDFHCWRFHRDQTVEMQPDGGAIVRFRASGMTELVWHLFSWGHKIEIVAPTSLRELMATELRVALSRHENPPLYVETKEISSG
ncbi:helix-turn-helix transcriptional regulator [Bradyrhizobium aeschynomenes]|uniref:helix-turn-helix transcriptional regulator n=1 Tax=Bradyrhizobium aeschynomenes TaxID=2734909 RepID=UPI00155655BA|nr:WYL domain-containing protein [Bradyrhizobium aeschynomenes]NPV22117.1 WYL domain-containing protein [Bradyrhizobium aeschynomenes]